MGVFTDVETECNSLPCTVYYSGKNVAYVLSGYKCSSTVSLDNFCQNPFKMI